MLMISSLGLQRMNSLITSQSLCKPSSRWAWLESWITSSDCKFVSKSQVYSYLNLNMPKILWKSLIWNPIKTPMSPNIKLTVDLLGKSVDSSLYRSMIGSLLYLTASRPDISYSVGVCVRYQPNPKESNIIALKRIIKYVKATTDFGVWYSKNTNDVLAGYSDANWAGNVDDRKSTSGGCFYMGNNLISWMSKNQNSISLSTTEAKYNVVGSCCTQFLWMQKTPSWLWYSSRTSYHLLQQY